MLWHVLSSLGIEKVFSLVSNASMNLFTGIPLSQEDEIHGYNLVSLLLGGEQREILLVVFNRFYEFSKEAFCRRSPISTRRNGL